MTLREMRVGQEAKVLEIAKGTGAERKLFEIGIIPGAKIRLVSRHPFHGPLVLEIGNSKIAVGRRVASSVLIALQD